jgi:hypothetical protein
VIYCSASIEIGYCAAALNRARIIGSFCVLAYWEQIGSLAVANPWQKRAKPAKLLFHSLSAEKILGNGRRAAPFIGGPVLLARLSPMDYHHVHYPDDA